MNLSSVEAFLTFELQNLHDFSQVLSTVRDSRSAIDCGRECIQLQNCYGFIYTKTTNHCNMLTCYNLDQWNTNGSLRAYVYRKSTELARGKIFTCYLMLQRYAYR